MVKLIYEVINLNNNKKLGDYDLYCNAYMIVILLETKVNLISQLLLLPMSIKKWNVALYQIDLRLYFYYKTNMYDILFDSEESYSTCISCDTRVLMSQIYGQLNLNILILMTKKN